jgi:phosphoribosylformylglycinamidine synthase
VHGTNKALALTTDCTPRYCEADPCEGGKQAVAEAWRNITAVGAMPLAVTDCMNFGNPERPEIMGQFAAAIEGMAQACRALDFPVVSGNVSLYNETQGKAILPTPAIGAVGLLMDLKRFARPLFVEGDEIIVIGETRGHLGQSLALREVKGIEAGPPPPIDLVAERRNGEFVRLLIASGEVARVHDVSDGGLLIALAEIALNSGVGCRLTPSEGAAFWFGEDQARYVIACAPDVARRIAERARGASIPARGLGQAGGDAIVIKGRARVSLNSLRAAHETFLPGLMGEA